MDINYIIENSIQERADILKAIDQLFPNIENYIELEKFEKLNFKLPDQMNISSELFGGPALLESILINASQQFCFWVNPDNQSTRNLSSSDFYDCSISLARNIILKKAVTLRKERLQILDSFNDLEESDKFVIDRILNSDIFNSDFFRKKKNLALMMIVRYSKDLIDYYPNIYPKEFIETINPAIDYQIPKILNYFGIITYPTKINEKIQNGILIEKDSIEELFIRSVAYKALIMIQEKYGYNQVELDTFMWYNRHNFNIPEEFKHHCTLTEDY